MKEHAMRWGLAIAVMALPLAAAAQPAPTPPPPSAAGCGREILKPVIATHTLPPYPKISQITGEEGTSILRVTIQADGVVSDTTTEKTSGSLRLDDAAASFVQENWRWQPFTCAKQVVTLVSVVWALHDRQQTGSAIVVEMAPADYPPEARAQQQQGVTLVALLLSPDGAVIDAKVTVSSNFPALDDKALEIAKVRWQWSPARMSGNPVKSVIFLAMQWSLGPARTPPK